MNHLSTNEGSLIKQETKQAKKNQQLWRRETELGKGTFNPGKKLQKKDTGERAESEKLKKKMGTLPVQS